MTATPVDIFSMLNKAQTEYNNNVNNSHHNSSVSSNVSAFFASVKGPAANVMNDNKMPDVQHGVPIFQHHHIIQNHPVQVQQQSVNFVNIDQIENQMQPGVSNNGESTYHFQDLEELWNAVSFVLTPKIVFLTRFSLNFSGYH